MIETFSMKAEYGQFFVCFDFLTQSHLVTCCVDQADLEFRELPASASPVLGLRACTSHYSWRIWTVL